MREPSPKKEKLPRYIYPARSGGGYEGLIRRAPLAPLRQYFPAGTPRSVLVKWVTDAVAERELGGRTVSGTLAADCQKYLETAEVSDVTRERRAQQLAWWCAQLVADGSDPVTVEDVGYEPVQVAKQDDPKRVKKNAVASFAQWWARYPGTQKKPLLGHLHRSELRPERLDEILVEGFAPTDKKNPTQFANTSNIYRTALFHLHSRLDRFDPRAANPLRGIKLRSKRKADGSKAKDPRLVVEILRHASNTDRETFGDLRLEVLAWVHITPDQLKRLDMPSAFHDVPDATEDDILNGRITLTIPPRFKGIRKGQDIPPPYTLPLNPFGVQAMRAYAANPEAWGTFTAPNLNRRAKAGARLAQEALAKEGITVMPGGQPINLLNFTLYCFKHSLATAARRASGRRFEPDATSKDIDGLRKSLGHHSSGMTDVYSTGAIDEEVIESNRATGQLLISLLRTPWKPKPLTLAKGLSKKQA